MERQEPAFTFAKPKSEEEHAEMLEARQELKEALNRETVLNYLNSNLEQKKKLPLIELEFTADSYEMLGEEMPEKDKIVEYLNGLQTKEGTWNTGKEHYVPTTAQILMAYERWGLKPPRSVEPFFSSVDTWNKAKAHIKKYTPANYWGGLWGYVACYVAQGRTPPWKQEYLDELKEKFDVWSKENHQRTHALASLLQLGEPIPQPEELARITLAQQKQDGRWEASHWNPPLPQTSFGIFTLETLRSKTDISIDESIAKATHFVSQCYREKERDKKNIAGFTMNPKDEKLDPLATAMGIVVSRPELFSKFVAPSERNKEV